MTNDLLSDLKAAAPVVAPSMLKCDYGDLASDMRRLAGTGWLHWDVMDGHFVPNLSYGAMVIAAAAKQAPNAMRHEAHLMISEPAKYVDEYIAAGCDLITFHIEAEGDAAELAKRIREAGRLAGISLNPGTPVSAIASLAGHIDNVLAMSVNPGFGGQSFMPEVLPKCREIRDVFGEDVCLSIDGGIDGDTLPQAAAEGVDLFVVGSAIFGTADYAAAISQLREAGRAARETA